MGRDRKKVRLDTILDLVGDNIDASYLDFDKKIRIFSLEGDSVYLQGEVYSTTSYMVNALKLCSVDSIDIQYDSGVVVLDIYVRFDEDFRYYNNVQDE